MAKSPAHRFGQIIEDILEDTLYDYCTGIAREHNLYLDHKHERQARKGKKEVQWSDINGNTHKLDIVMENGGSEKQFGKPKAFIEVAWRRYKKHAKAKAQEISVAIKPLVAKYSDSSPFFGAALAGEFTNNSLEQMRSEGFEVLYISTRVIEDAYAGLGIDAHWDESTSEAELQRRVEQMELMSKDDKKKIGRALMAAIQPQWDRFVNKLNIALERDIENVRVIALYGDIQQFTTIHDACKYIAHKPDECKDNTAKLYKYEITVSYTNGDKIEMQFKEKNNAMIYLKQLEQ